MTAAASGAAMNSTNAQSSSTTIAAAAKPKTYNPRGTSAIWVAKSDLAKADAPKAPEVVEPSPSPLPSDGNGNGDDNPKKEVDAGKKVATVVKKEDASRKKGITTMFKAKEDHRSSSTSPTPGTPPQAVPQHPHHPHHGNHHHGYHGQQGHQASSLSRQIALSKLNAGAAVFVPKVSSSLPSSLGVIQGQPGVISLPHSSLAPLADEDYVDPQGQGYHQPKPVALTEELRSQIVQQGEFYFSDRNLSTDTYLMKFVKKDPDGFVPIALVGSFKKMKALTRNHAAIAAAFRTSTKLVVSEDGKRVRRTEPLEDMSLDDIQSRTVVAENLPEDNSIASLEKLFGTVGTVKSVRICEPEPVNGVNQMGKHKVDRLVSNKLHALVEYETVEQAEKAVADLTDQRNWRSGLHVRLLVRRIYPASKQHNHHQFQHGAAKNNGNRKNNGAAEAGDGAAEDDAAGAEADNEHSLETPHDEAGEAPESAMKRVGGRGGVGRGMPGGGRGRGRSRGLLNGVMLGASPQTGTLLSNEAGVSKPPPGPRMPDGTKGFTFGRGRDVVSSSS